MEFGQYLKQLRKANRYKLWHVSELSGISHGYLSQIENGRKQNVSTEICRQLSQAFNVSYIGMLIKAGHVTEEEVLFYRKENGIDDRTATRS